MKNALLALCILLLGLTVWAQDVPKVEIPVGFSFINVHPNLAPITSFNVFGGGGQVDFNFGNVFGIKADFMDYAFGSSWTRKLHNLGYMGSASANLFTYQFGPQLKRHSGKFQPFIEALYGAAHSSGYASALKAKGDGSYQLTGGGGNNNAFAMELGGGLDIVLSKTVQVRPLEVDYQLTRFGYKTYSANQNNFKYFAGINFTLGGK